MTPRLEPAFSAESPDWKQIDKRLEECRKMSEEWARVAGQADIPLKVEIDPLLTAEISGGLHHRGSSEAGSLDRYRRSEQADRRHIRRQYR